MTHPIPTAALDDRLGIVGTSGSGKTYGAGIEVERLLAQRSRTIIVDPLGVWWGLRLDADGKRPSRFEVVIFGGPHGDMPITEHAGAIIGETVASMKESAIIDLSELGTKAAERRFMLAFLTALYKHASGEQLHVVFDEADMWAPQQIRDRDQEPQKLLGMMETIVRRGRIKGFVPWLISQRPAVLNKDVLSQVDGLVAFKLTASQDRNALKGWIEGQADVGEWPRINAELPTQQVGEAIVWLPGHGKLESTKFPEKVTFDSSRAPKRGEKRKTAELQPLDLGKLKERLSTVEQEAKANDPKALKSRIVELERQVAGRGSAGGGLGKLPTKAASAPPDRAAIKEAEQRGYTEGLNKGRAIAEKLLANVQKRAIDAADGLKRFVNVVEGIGVQAMADGDRLAAERKANVPAPKSPLVNRISEKPVSRQPASPKPHPPTENAVQGNGADTTGDTTGPQRTVLKALAWWKAMGNDKPTRAQVAGIAGWKITSGHLKNVLGSLNTAGLVSYPAPGRIAMTPAGEAAAPDPDLSQTLIDGVRAALNGPQRQVFEALLKGGVLARDELAAALGWEPTSGHLKNILGSMRTLEIVDYPQPGQVALHDWVTQ